MHRHQLRESQGAQSESADRVADRHDRPSTPDTADPGCREPGSVDGIPDEYLQMQSGLVPADQWDGWLAGVRDVYRQMVRITVTPTWAKVIDFEKTLPSAVAELAAKRER